MVLRVTRRGNKSCLEVDESGNSPNTTKDPNPLQCGISTFSSGLQTVLQRRAYVFLGYKFGDLLCFASLTRDTVAASLVPSRHEGQLPIPNTVNCPEYGKLLCVSHVSVMLMHRFPRLSVSVL